MKKAKSPHKKQREHNVGYFLIGLTLAALGLLLLFYPAESIKTIGYIIAFAALLFGLLCLVRTLSGLRRGVRFAFSMLGSIATIVCAIVLFFTVEGTFATFVSIIGLVIVIDSSFKLQTVVLSHRYGQKAFWILLVAVCLGILGGFFCIRSTATSHDLRILARLLGLSLIVCGTENLLSLFYLPSLHKNEAAGVGSISDSQTPIKTGESEHQS